MLKNIFILMVFALGPALPGCGSESGAKDCVPAPKDAAQKTIVERTRLKVDKDGDWCRACVMGLKGYASCQRVYALEDGQERVALRQRALDKACLDAGYEPGKCPVQAVVGVLCKGEKEPEDMPSAAQALQRFYEGKPIRQPEDKKDGSPTD